MVLDAPPLEKQAPGNPGESGFVKSPRKILVVQTAFAGDVVLVTPLVEAVKQAFPEADVDVLLAAETEVLFKNNPFLRRVLAYDKRQSDKGAASFVRWVKRVRGEQYDLALVPHRSLRSALLVFLARIPRRIGFNRSAGFYLFTDVVSYPFSVHEVDRNLRLLQPIGWKGTVPAPELYPGEPEKQAVDFFLKENQFQSGDSFVVMAPGSLWPTKRWPSERFRETAEILHQRRGLRAVLIGGKDDIHLCESIRENSGEFIFNAAGRFSLLESAELIRRARVLLSNDSAPLHLASGVGTRVAALFGPTVPAFGFAPYGSGHVVIQKNLECRPCAIHGSNRCPKKHFRCMLDITAEEVAKILESFVYPDNSFSD